MRGVVFVLLLAACGTASAPPPSASAVVAPAPPAPAPPTTVAPSPCDIARAANEGVLAAVTPAADPRVAVARRFAEDASAQCVTTTGGAWALLLTEATLVPNGSRTELRFHVAFVDAAGEVHTSTRHFAIDHEPEMAGDGTLRIDHLVDSPAGPASAFVTLDSQYYEDTDHLRFVFTWRDGEVSEENVSRPSDGEEP